MFLNILILSFVLISIAMIGMALSILLKKNGRFPSYQVGHNKDMARLGIRCVKHEEIKCYNKRLKEKGCAACEQVC
jgi:hypothetical protein